MIGWDWGIQMSTIKASAIPILGSFFWCKLIFWFIRATLSNLKYEIWHVSEPSKLFITYELCLNQNKNHIHSVPLVFVGKMSEKPESHVLVISKHFLKEL